MSSALQDLWPHLQRQLFPVLADELGDLGEKDRQFVQVIALLPLGKFLEPYRWCGVGCPPHERAWLVHAYVAKAVYQFPTTEALVESLKARLTLRRLCGWESVSDIPSTSTFSRAFARFAADELPQRLHETMVKTHCGPKLVGHSSHDSTAIAVPERPPAAAPVPPAQTAEPVLRRKRGRPRRAKSRHRCRPHACSCSPSARWPRTWPTCLDSVTAEPNEAPKGTWNTGAVTSCI